MSGQLVLGASLAVVVLLSMLLAFSLAVIRLVTECAFRTALESDQIVARVAPETKVEVVRFAALVLR